MPSPVASLSIRKVCSPAIDLSAANAIATKSCSYTYTHHNQNSNKTPKSTFQSSGNRHEANSEHCSVVGRSYRSSRSLAAAAAGKEQLPNMKHGSRQRASESIEPTLCQKPLCRVNQPSSVDSPIVFCPEMQLSMRRVFSAAGRKLYYQ